MELHQKTLLETRSFFLLPNKLKLYLKDAGEEYENYISYEKIKSETQIRCRKNNQLFFITTVATSFAVCILLQSLILNSGFVYAVSAIILALFLAILYRFKRQNYIIIETVDHQKIVFFRNKPNRRALEKFLSQLWRQRKQYLRDKYFYIDSKQDPRKQTERLRWLLEQKAISKTEFKFALEDWIIDKSYQSQ